MLRPRSWRSAVLAGLLLAVSVDPAAARRPQITCRDGCLGATLRVGHHRAVLPVCDVGDALDGACTFDFCAGFACAQLVPACVGPGSGICQPGQPPELEVRLAVGERRLVTVEGFPVVLRCRPRGLARCP